MTVRKLAKWFLVRLPIILIIAFTILFITLKLVERYPDPLKEGIEQFLSEASQTHATIATMSNIQFVPSIHFDMSDITFHDKSNAAITDVSIDRIIVKLPFWSAIIGGRRLNALSLEGAIIGKEVLTPHELTINTAKIHQKSEASDVLIPILIAEGEYRGLPSLFQVKLKALKKGYKLPKDISFSLTVGAYELTGQIKQTFSRIILDNTVLKKNGVVSSEKEYVLTEKRILNKDNPLSCLIYSSNLGECDTYLESQL